MSKRYWLACDASAASSTGGSLTWKTDLPAPSESAAGSRFDHKHTEEEIAMGTMGKVVVFCMHCKRVRLDSPVKDRWCLVQVWVAEPPEKVSHGLCPECLEKHYPAQVNGERIRTNA